MARKKQYIESEVIEKAMLLFWKNGYENTSMQMLEDKMGINKFSIYSSFDSKHGLFLKTLEAYKKRTKSIFDNLTIANNGIADIKKFFYDSVELCSKEENEKGCLITSTYYEFSKIDDEIVNNHMKAFVENLRNIFVKKLKINTTKSTETVLAQANYLLLAKHGLSTACRVNNKKEIEDYIEMTFKNI